MNAIGMTEKQLIVTVDGKKKVFELSKLNIDRETFDAIIDTIISIIDASGLSDKYKLVDILVDFIDKRRTLLYLILSSLLNGVGENPVAGKKKTSKKKAAKKKTSSKPKRKPKPVEEDEEDLLEDDVEEDEDDIEEEEDDDDIDELLNKLS